MPRGPSTPTSIARAWPALPQVPRDHGAEFQHPATDALVGEVEPTLCKQFLDITIAQGEAQVEPNRMLNHGRRETVPAIRDRKHLAAYGRSAAMAKLS